MINIKKRILILLSSCAFVALMLFNVSVSMEDSGMATDISLSGITTLAYGCNGERTCFINPPSCGGGHCVHRWVCTACFCEFKYISDLGSGTGTCNY
jgi:hypothetical protein